MTGAPENSERPILNVEGDLVALGPLRRDLLPLYTRWINDLGAARTLGAFLPMTLEGETKWYDESATSEKTVPFTVYARQERPDTFPDWQPNPVCTQTVNAANDTLTGTASKDVLCGDSRNNTIDGGGGNDIILAQGGNDTLTGVTGNDTLNGGPGTDTALYSGTTAVVASLATEFATGVGSDVLLGIENLTGSDANDRLTGSSAANSLVGGGGADAMFGVGGNDALDSMDGVTGNDSLDGGTGTDTKITDASEKSIVGFP
jgi:RTX calcium-binding nonapeptide repeat (4 copies)